MTLKSFIEKYNGQKVDFDKKFGCQCVDLFRQYCQDVLKIEHTGSVVGAKDLFENYNSLPKEKKYFVKFSNDIEPHQGDVAIWGASTSNVYGHVAIVISTFENCLIVLEQNGFKQDGTKIVVRSKTNLLGYLRYKSLQR